MALEELIRFRGLVFEETGKWARGSVWSINGEPKFLCNDCSIKALKNLKDGPGVLISDLSEEQLYEKMMSEAIETPELPPKYKDLLYSEEGDWRYRLRQDSLVKCEDCGKIVI